MFLAGDKLLDVSVKKYSWLFSCVGEKFGYGRKIVGGGTGIAAGAEEAHTSECKFLLHSSQWGFAQQVHDVASLLKIEY